MKNEILLFKNQDVKLEENSVRSFFEHIGGDGELEEKSNVQKMHFSNLDKPVSLYSLDVIISVGYRVNSKQGIIFRKWATGILKDYMIKGYVVNQKRLEYLEKTVKLIDIAGRIDINLKGNE